MHIGPPALQAEGGQLGQPAAPSLHPNRVPQSDSLERSFGGQEFPCGLMAGKQVWDWSRWVGAGWGGTTHLDAGAGGTSLVPGDVHEGNRGVSHEATLGWERGRSREVGVGGKTGRSVSLWHRDTGVTHSRAALHPSTPGGLQGSQGVNHLPQEGAHPAWLTEAGGRGVAWIAGWQAGGHIFLW